MGTQTEITKKIREKNADYILALKNNQLNLYDDVKMFIDEYCMDSEAKSKNSYAYTIDNSHGRLKKRECFVVMILAGLIIVKNGLISMELA